MQQGWYEQNINGMVASVWSPWCLCVLSGCRAGIWVPRGSAGCRSRWWTRCFSVGPIWTSAAQTDSLDEGKKNTWSTETTGSWRISLRRYLRLGICCTGGSVSDLFYHLIPALQFESHSILITGLTSRHLLHEDLYEAVLAEGSEVLDDVLVL